MKVQPKRRGRPPKAKPVVVAPKRRGRPPKSEVKKRTDEAVAKAREGLAMYARLVSLNKEIQRLNDDIANLKHQAIGYKAVVSYLENQLGLKGSQ